MSIDVGQLTEVIVTTKRSLRAELPGRADVFGEIEDHVRAEVREIRAQADRGSSVVPELDHAAIAAGSVTVDQTDEIRRRGVVIVRNVFPRTQAEAWNEELGEYVTANGYHDAEVDHTLDQYFSTLESARPQIFGIYWSRPQVQARQAVSLAETRACLNSLWVSRHDGAQLFDPDQECTYADRIRRREMGDTSLGLSAHMDAGSVERWLDPAYRRVYRHVFSGQWRSFDPFDGAHRTDVREIPSPAVCSMFRSFQGWTALTRQGPDDGTLRVVPIAVGVSYLLLRALQNDVAEDDLCGAQPGRALSATPAWHASLLDGLITIPVVEPGDTVWWHPDLLHGVEDRHAGLGYSNVMYIGAAPDCAKNRAYLQRQWPTFINGASPPDFAPENHEVAYRGRATAADLTELGRRQMRHEPSRS